jgi:hypothetical protein
MSPFYFKEGEKSRRWKGEPRDIRDRKGNDLGIMISKVEDPEQINVFVASNSNSYVIGERGEVIFPNQNCILNRDGFKVVDAGTRKTIAKVTHREK